MIATRGMKAPSAAMNDGTAPNSIRFAPRGKAARRSHNWAILKIHMADDKLYSAQYVGSGTFIISKPKRKAAKRRQSKLKGTVRGARK
jgi:hypothetical protein